MEQQAIQTTKNKIFICEGDNIKVFLHPFQGKHLFFKKGVLINAIKKTETPIECVGENVKIGDVELSTIHIHQLTFKFKGEVQIGDYVSSGCVNLRTDNHFKFLSVPVASISAAGLELGKTYDVSFFPQVIRNEINLEVERYDARIAAEAIEADIYKEQSKEIVFSAFCASRKVLDKHGLLYSPNILNFSKSKAGGVRFLVKKGYVPLSEYMHQHIHPINGGTAHSLHVGYFKDPHSLIEWLFGECKYDRKNRTIYTHKRGMVIGHGGETIKFLQSFVGHRLKVVKV